MSGRRDSSKRSRDLALSELEGKAKELEKSRQHFQNEINRIDHSLTQIRVEYAKLYNESSMLLNLPTEVICVVLELATQSHPLEDSETDERSLLPEVVMSQVCRHLRDVALNNPALWTRFHFFLGKVQSSMSNTLTRFDTYIKRSRSQNLELYLDFRTARPGQLGPMQAHLKLLDMATKHINRWKIVTLMSNGTQNIEDFCPILIAASAPNLEYFSYSPEWSLVRQKHVITGLEPGLLQGGTPKLRYLLLDTSTFRSPAFLTVTTLRIEANIGGVLYSWESFLTILSLPLLTNFSIVADIFIGPNSNQVPIVPMNNLKHLRYSETPYMNRMLPFLRAPLLETLMIHGFNDWGLTTRFPLHVPSESYFFPSLQNLILLNSSRCSSHSAQLIAQLSKNIDRLTIIRTFDFFIALSSPDAPFDNVYWPKLSGITTQWPYPESDDFETLCDIVLARPKATLKLLLLQELHGCWESVFPQSYGVMRERCTVEVLRSEKEVLLMQSSWPPGVDVPDYASRDDPFQRRFY